MDQVDIHIPIPKCRIDKPFLMAVEDTFPTKGHGTIVMGCIERENEKQKSFDKDALDPPVSLQKIKQGNM
jgi:translation elongation factor EF-Tu-like GTPase